MISGAPRIGTLRVGPSAQTILVAALEQLDGTLGRDEFIRRASNSEDEHDALFFQQCAQLMAKLNANAPLARITQLNGLPVCNGVVSPMAGEALTARGIKFSEKQLPNPLK